MSTAKSKLYSFFYSPEVEIEEFGYERSLLKKISGVAKMLN